MLDGFSNPFLVARGGDFKFRNRASGFAKVAAVKGLENAVKPAGDLKAKSYQNISILRRSTLGITSRPEAINPARFD